jgi:hypothetical protein
MKNFILLSLLVAASPTLENVYSTQVLAACVMSLAVFAIPTDSWPETCERLTGLSWKNLPLTEIVQHFSSTLLNTNGQFNTSQHLCSTLLDDSTLFNTYDIRI